MKKAYLSIFFAFVMGIGGGNVFLLQAAEPKIDLQALLAKKVPILLEFGSTCCPSCQYSKETLDTIATTYGGRAVAVGVDVAVNKNLARDFRIRLTPTQVFLTPDGKEFFRKEGNLQRDEIVQVFNKMGVAPAAQAGGPISAPQAPVVPSVPGYSATRQ